MMPIHFTKIIKKINIDHLRAQKFTQFIIKESTFNRNKISSLVLD